jgi:sugar phosphate isomerase/epimerase
MGVNGVGRMDIGFTASPRPVEAYFPLAAEHGFRRLDLGCSAPLNFPHTFTAERIARVKQLGQQYDIAYGLHTASFVNTAELMPQVRAASEQHLLDYIHLAKQLEAEYCVIHCGFHFSLFQDAVMAALLQTLRAAVTVAEELALPLVIENMNRVHPDCEIVYLGVTIDELRQVFTAIPSPYLGLALDIGHAHLLPEGVDAWLDAFPENIMHLHLHDNDGVLDQHLPIGEGSIPYPAILDRLHAIGFTGTGTLEVRFPDAAIASLRALTAYLTS